MTAVKEYFFKKYDTNKRANKRTAYKDKQNLQS